MVIGGEMGISAGRKYIARCGKSGGSRDKGDRGLHGVCTIVIHITRSTYKLVDSVDRLSTVLAGPTKSCARRHASLLSFPPAPRPPPLYQRFRCHRPL